jgi:hypothetical protein
MTPTRKDIEDLAIELYSACFDQYDRHKPPFVDPHTGRPLCRDVREAWTWIHESQRDMCRDQARRALQWVSRRIPSSTGETR